jgi:uncharacterized membrane protein
MKTNFVITALFVLLISTLVTAVSIEGTDSINLCQCETVRETYEVCAEEAGTYSLTPSGSSSKWIRIAPSSVDLEAGECEDFYVFTTPECYARSGTFPVDIEVNGPETESKRVNISVDQCHTFDFEVTPRENSSIACEQNTYDIYVKNTGKFTDEFVFNQTGLEDSWVSYIKDSFVLTAGEELNTTLVVESACNADARDYPFELELQNTQTNADETKELDYEITDFTPFTHTFNSVINTCSENTEEFSFFIRNASEYDDEYTLTLDAPEHVSLSTNNLVLNPDETEEVILTVSSTEPTSDFIGVTLSSEKYQTDYQISMRVDVDDCYNHSLELESTGVEYCIGNNIGEYVLENTGTKTSTVTLSVSGIDVEPVQYNIESGEEEVIVVNFNEIETGTKTITVVADSGYEQRTLEYDVSFEDCYGTNINAEALDVCLSSTMNKTINLENNGTRDQDYELSINADWITLSDDSVSLDSGESDTIEMSLEVPSNVRDNYVLTAVSENATITRTLPVNVLPNETCYGFSAEHYTSPIDVNCCSGEITELYITNTGFFDQEITLTKIAPPWVAFSEDTLTVEAGETAKTYVYFSPPAGTDGDYIATIRMENQEGVVKTHDFNLNVFGGHCGVYLGADIDVNNEITKTEIYIRKEVEVEFNVRNDSNVAFNVLDMNTDKYSSTFEFERGINLQPGETVRTKMIIGLGENPPAQEDVDVNVNVLTSVGTFTKTQRINLSESNEVTSPSQDISITGLFSNFVAPASGILLLIVILIIIVVVATRTPKTKK